MLNSPFDPQQLAEQNLPTVMLDAGEKVFLANDDGDCLYVVVSGLIEIITVGQQLEAVGPGGIFGEIALIDRGCRSASAMAATKSEVIQINRDSFLQLLRQQPTFALHVMAALVARLRRVTTSPDIE
ncbi:MAG: cyclic nucleotide-binding domain-containing protein [Hyphomicrobiaceae bacterium]